MLYTFSLIQNVCVCVCFCVCVGGGGGLGRAGCFANVRLVGDCLRCFQTEKPIGIFVKFLPGPGT